MDVVWGNTVTWFVGFLYSAGKLATIFTVVGFPMYLFAQHRAKKEEADRIAEQSALADCSGSSTEKERERDRRQGASAVATPVAMVAFNEAGDYEAFDASSIVDAS